MEKNFFQIFHEEEQRLFAELKEYDQHQKNRGEFDCRYITKSFADRKAFYQIVGETPKKYVLQWILGEDPFPDWGIEVKLPKREVEEIIRARDKFENIIIEKRKSNQHINA